MSKKFKIAILIFLVIILGIIIFLFAKPSDEIKEYSDSEISFQYSSRYKLEEKDNYLEFTEKKSNIIFEIRKLTSVENNASFDSLVDNIVYNYQKGNKSITLASEYNDYKFTNGLSGYRIVFENKVENLNTLMLITLENLNLTVITLNAYQEEFEFLTDSAELIMNTLTFKKGYEYLTLDIEYPETKELKFESKGQENLIFPEQTKKYSAISNDYKYIVNIPSDYNPTSLSDGNLKFVSSDGATNLSFEIRTSYYEYDAEYDIFKSLYDNYQVIYGYTKYNNKIYYVIKKQYSFLGNWNETVEIADLISYDRYLIITIKSEKHIENSEIEKFLKNITYEYDLEGQNKINSNKIEGNLFVVDKTDSYSFDSLIGLDVLKVNYSFLNNQCRYSQSDNTSYRAFNCNDSSIQMDIIKNNASFNNENLQKYEYWSNYQYKLLETKKINGNEFKHYKETYTYTSSFFELDNEYHYFILKLNENYNFLITIKGDLSNLDVDDFLDVEVEKYKYKVVNF